MSNRIEEIVNEIQYRLKLTHEQIAERVGYSRPYFSNAIKNGTSKKVISALEKEFAETVQNITEPEAAYLSKRRDKKNNSTKKNVIPFYDAEGTASQLGTDMTPIHAPAGTIDIGDLLHDSSSAIRIYGNSMLPSYPPGCVVGLVNTSTGFIQPGEVYVIETTHERMLKRLFYKNDDTASDTFICYSDNTMTFTGGARDGKLAYPPFELQRSEVIKLFIVTGVIKRNTNSIIMNRN